MGTIHHNCYLFYTVLFILFSGSVSAGINQLDGVSKESQTSTVYVLSNRETKSLNNSLTTLNSIAHNPGLDFIRASSHSNDSLQIYRIDSVEFLTEISVLQRDWVFFVHGDAKTLEQSIQRGLEIQQLYDLNVLIFSWPSKEPNINGAKNFKNSQSNVNESLTHFVSALDFIRVFRQINTSFGYNQKISLFCHSLGNLYLKKMISNNLQSGFSGKMFDNIILNAAAVNQQSHKEWVEKLNIQNQIFITSNKNDFNLKGVRIFTSSRKQLGEKITLPLATNAKYIHFDKIVGFKFPTGQTHTYFIGEIPDEHKIVKLLYFQLFHGENINLNNRNEFLYRKDSLGFELLSKPK